MRAAAIILLSLILLSALALSGSAMIDPYDYPIVKLYKEATTYSNEVYKIPIEVKLLDLSEDLTWFKVKIKFSLGPLNFDYVGWTYLPVSKLLAEKAEKEQLAQVKN